MAEPRRSEKKPPRLARVAARVAGLQTPVKPAVQLPLRKRGADILTPMRWKIIAKYYQLSGGKDRLPRGGMLKLKSQFPNANLSTRSIQRLAKEYKDQTSVSTVDVVELSRKRGDCGGAGMKLTEELAAKMVAINDKFWGKLSVKKLAGKLKSEGFDCSRESVRRWCKELGAVRRRRYIRPKLSLRHKLDRLTWVIEEYDRETQMFGDNRNTCHGDEKWFYLTHDGTVCRVFPKHVRNEDGEVESTVAMPGNAKVYHKSRMPKVMFLAVTAKPRPEHDFDGKVGIWPFTVVRKAKRSHSSTGTVAGVTEILESVTVTAEEYRKVMLRKDGVFDSIRRKMWWFAPDSGEPEAGQIVWYQHDGARPHTAKANERNWARHGKMKGFDIRVVTQPAQSPDLNVNDLAFFASLQSDTELVAKENVKDLSAAVIACWEEYPQDRMSAVWSCLYASFKGILETGGDNIYGKHTGSRKAHHESREAGEIHDRSCPLQVITAAEKVRDELASALDGAVSGVESEVDSDSEDDG